MRPLKLKLLWLFLGWLYVALIFFFCLTPDPPHVAEFEQSDKLKHLAAYGLLMFYFCQLYASRSLKITHALIFCSMGIAIEFLQRWGGVRSFEVADMIANACGVGLGFLLAAQLPLYKLLPKA